MATGVRLNVQDSRRIREFLSRLSSDERDGVTFLAMKALARRTEALAKEEFIVRGRGLKSPPLADRLTFRTGRLTRSISTDESQAPRRVVVGSRVVYAPVHELGLTVPRPIGPSRDRRRVRLKGRAEYPKRPFLQPAAEKVLRTEARDIFVHQLRRLRASVS